VTPDHEYHVPWLENFPRSEIVSVHEFPDDDFYLSTYLEGQSGAQGFDTVPRRAQPVHPLARRRLLLRRLPPVLDVRARRRPHVPLLRAEVLEVARTAHPGDYETLVVKPTRWRSSTRSGVARSLYLDSPTATRASASTT